MLGEEKTEDKGIAGHKLITVTKTGIRYYFNKGGGAGGTEVQRKNGSK